MLIKTAVEKHFINIHNPCAFSRFTNILYNLLDKALCDGYQPDNLYASVQIDQQEIV